MVYWHAQPRCFEILACQQSKVSAMFRCAHGWLVATFSESNALEDRLTSRLCLLSPSCPDKHSTASLSVDLAVQQGAECVTL